MYGISIRYRWYVAMTDLLLATIFGNQKQENPHCRETTQHNTSASRGKDVHADSLTFSPGGRRDERAKKMRPVLHGQRYLKKV
jgi:hypothetical protein